MTTTLERKGGDDMTWNEITERFNAIPEGGLTTDKECNIWIKPVQDQTYHLDGVFISLEDGSISHYSRVMEHLKD